MRTVRCLSFHATYVCRETGACCTAGWPIPVEADRLMSLEAALGAGRLQPAASMATAAPLYRPAHAPRETPAVLGRSAGRCVFHRPTGPGRCEIHREMGHRALPLACRSFPRVSVIDPRGVCLTLSSYCPTAAALLESTTPIAVVSNADRFRTHDEYTGLDATSALPPLLRPDMLMDWDAWWDWEAASLAYLIGATSAHHALAGLRTIVEHVRTWRPADGALAAHVRAAFRANLPPAPSLPGRDPDVVLDEVLDAIPTDLQPAAGTLARRGPAPAVETARRFVAAHLFANWTAHLGAGLRTWLRSIEAPLALIDGGLDVRTADLLLRHLADPDDLTRIWSRAEQEGPH